MKFTHFLQVPFTGLGLFFGMRGNRWLKNRIKIFKQFVIPSLQAQTSLNFILHICWRYEEKKNHLVREFQEYLKGIAEFQTLHTFSGILFYDDKYPDAVARIRLIESIHSALGEMLNSSPDSDDILVTIQPSDDCYISTAVEGIQGIFALEPTLQALCFSRGYICNYLTRDVHEYNPETNPPFYTIRYPREIFADPLKQVEYTALKRDVGKYKAGTPLPSHEYVSDCLVTKKSDLRAFLVGTHSENISTYFNHPYRGVAVPTDTLTLFGLKDVPVLKLKLSFGKFLLRKLPHSWQKRLRYIVGEKLTHRIYDFFRS